MGQILVGIKNFLDLINQNWTLITVIIGLGILVFKQVKRYTSLSEQEKIDLALEQIRITALKMVTDAEKEYDKWVKAGSIKRAEVIDKIFKDYPILIKATDKETLIKNIENDNFQLYLFRNISLVSNKLEKPVRIYRIVCI